MCRRVINSILLTILVCYSILTANVISTKDFTEDSEWFNYSGSPYYFLGLPGERAIFYNVEDFGLEYPVNLLAI